MTGNPNEIIEEYLKLVYEHLPESISEDVITELRTYMVETARDFGNGEITIQSAKKVVAQFGAPSEVANEYKYSMLPEAVPEDAGDSSSAEAIPSIISEPEDKIEKYRPKEGSPKSFLEFFFQGVSIALLWLLLVVIGSTLLGPVWLYPSSIITLFFQVLIVTFGIGFLTYSLKRQKRTLWTYSYPEWSFLQKWLTLPENIIKEPSNILLAFDILGSIIGIGLYFFSSNFAPSPYYIPIIGLPVCFAFVAKIYNSGKRITILDTTRYIRREVVTTFTCLLLINSSLIWIISYYLVVNNLLTFLLWLYSILWGPVLLFQLVINSGELWWEVESIEVAATPVQKLVLAHSIKNIVGSTILRMIGWIALLTMILTYFLMISVRATSPWYAPLFIAVFFGPIFLTPIILYFVFRYWRVSIGASKSVFGERSRLEALGDIAISIAAFFGIMNSISFWLFSNGLLDQYSFVFHDLGALGALHTTVAYVSSDLLFVIALILRITGDFLEFSKKRKSSAISFMIVSSRILIVGISLRAGVDILAYYPVLFPYLLLPGFLLLVVLIAFQSETSSLKQREMRSSNSKEHTQQRFPNREIVKTSDTAKGKYQEGQFPSN